MHNASAYLTSIWILISFSVSKVLVRLMFFQLVESWTMGNVNARPMLTGIKILHPANPIVTWTLSLTAL